LKNGTIWSLSAIYGKRGLRANEDEIVLVEEVSAGPEVSKRAVPTRQQARRVTTEEGIIDAFERLLIREGVGGLGVNALIKEAGVGKKQVYEYFGGLPGVATEWVKRRGVWPPIETTIGEPLTEFLRRPPAERILIVNRNYASMLRANAPLSELLMGEFTKTPEVKDAVDHVRQLIREDFEKIMFADGADPTNSFDLMALSTIAYSAASYLAMRAHSQARFFGFDLGEDAAWDRVIGMFERVIELGSPQTLPQS
jgi:AcrR family transcriptional regulator